MKKSSNKNSSAANREKDQLKWLPRLKKCNPKITVIFGITKIREILKHTAEKILSMFKVFYLFCFAFFSVQVTINIIVTKEIRRNDKQVRNYIAAFLVVSLWQTLYYRDGWLSGSNSKLKWVKRERQSLMYLMAGSDIV